jgi:diaminobutyrate-2-oxoglutarate transaminase/L-2,4-diaminobutyrate decarboxylase
MALKMSRKCTGRQGIFAFRGCFHGSTISANSLTGNAGDGDIIRSAAHIHHMPLPRVQASDCPYGRGGEESVELCLLHVQGALEDNKGGTNLPAAMIIEPVQSDGGIIPVPPRFLEGLRKLCDTHGVILISDEVQCGFGKTGHLFGYQRASIVPDILVCSKAWGGGQPLSFVLYRNLSGAMAHTGTWRGNQLAF